MKHGDFTALADSYARWRPGYSPFVLDAFLALSDSSQSGRKEAGVCADVGAGRAGFCGRT